MSCVFFSTMVSAMNFSSNLNHKKNWKRVMVLFMPGLFCLLCSEQIIAPNQFAYFPWMVLCSHCTIVKQAKVHTLTGLSLRHYIPATCVLVALCIVGQLHDNSFMKISRRLPRCIEEVKYLINIWAAHMKTLKFIKSWVNQRKRRAGTLCQRCHAMAKKQTAIHGGTRPACQTCIKTIVPVAGSVVFTQQINRFRVWMESSQDCLFEAISAQCNCRVHVCLNKRSQRGKRPFVCFGTSSQIDPGVEALQDRLSWGRQEKKAHEYTVWH